MRQIAKAVYHDSLTLITVGVLQLFVILVFVYENNYKFILVYINVVVLLAV